MRGLACGPKWDDTVGVAWSSFLRALCCSPSCRSLAPLAPEGYTAAATVQSMQQGRRSSRRPRPLSRATGRLGQRPPEDRDSVAGSQQPLCVAPSATPQVSRPGQSQSAPLVPRCRANSFLSAGARRSSDTPPGVSSRPVAARRRPPRTTAWMTTPAQAAR